MRLPKTGTRWWWAFAVCIAAPALVLAILGVRTIDLERVEQRQGIESQQRQTALLADTTLSAALSRIQENLLRQDPDPAAGAPSFSLDDQGVLIFRRDRVYFAETGNEPPEARVAVPPAVAASVDEALAAEARAEFPRAIAIYQRIGKNPQLGAWAGLALARLRVRQQPHGFLDWIKELAPGGQDSLSPEGVPVMLLATGYVTRLPLGDAAACGPFLADVLAQLRAGRWWLSYHQRKLYDAELRTAIATIGGVAPGGDARLVEIAAVERIVRQTAPFGHEGAPHPPAQAGRSGLSWTELDGYEPLLLITRERAGVALSGQRLTGFLQTRLGHIHKTVPYPIAVADSSGHLLWGDATALKGKASFPLRVLFGWEFHAGEYAPGNERRQFLWYAFLALLLMTLAFGLAATIRIVKRELELARLQAEFAASVTHEFKSPIAGIRLLLERITGGHVLDKATIREYQHTAQRETDRLERLVNRLLETHRIQSGEKRYQFAPHCIIDIVETAVAHFSPQAGAKRITVTLKTDDVLREIDLDRTSIQDSIENLLDNAIKYSPPDTNIEVSVEHGAKELRVCVRDQGIGIETADLPRIFDRFYRGRRGEQQSVRGTGLGLALVKAVAEGHGGSVTVKSAPGQGSEFCLCIPIREEETYVPSLDRG
ncbi:MAG TPA: HAMP domain-containing sensor histidine kinase [Bryobacteraceae bacterium]|nr:HAMP domain-containing sensor histidine kinase [Bryobacteraceae bacterium]